MLKSPIVASLILVLCASLLAQNSDLETRRKALDSLLKEQWEYTLKNDPIFASIIGDKRYNDKLGDESLEAVKKDYQQEREFLKRFEAIDTTGFPEQEVLNKELMVLNLKNDIEGEKFEGYLMPVNQMSGIHLQAPQVVSLLSFQTVKDYDDYITRMKGLSKIFDQVTERMKLGTQKGLMPPQFLLEKVTQQTRGIVRKNRKNLHLRNPSANSLKLFLMQIKQGYEQN